MSFKPFLLLPIAAAVVFIFSASPGEAVQMVFQEPSSSCDSSDGGATPPPRILEAYVPGIDFTGEEIQTFTGCLPGNRFVEAMAVTFSVEVDFSTLLPDQFKVTGSSGDFVDVSIPTCATQLPAGIGELFTVTLAGNLVSSSDISKTVEVVVSPTTGIPLRSVDGVELTGLFMEVQVMSGPKLVLARALDGAQQIQTYWSSSVFGPMSRGMSADALFNFTLVDVYDNIYTPTSFDDDNGVTGDLDNILVLNVPEGIQAADIFEVRVQADTLFDVSYDPNPFTSVTTDACKVTQPPAQLSDVPRQAPITCEDPGPPEILAAYLPDIDYPDEDVERFTGGCSTGFTNVELMTVTFSVEVDFSTLVPDQFQVLGTSGDLSEAICATLSPANEGESFSVTLAGNFASDPDSLPMSVDVVASPSTGISLLSIDAEDLTGLYIDVDVMSGPKLVLARVLDGREQIETYWSSSVFGPMRDEILSFDALANFTLIDVNGNAFIPIGFDDNNAFGISGDLDNILVLDLPGEVEAADLLEVTVQANTVFDYGLVPNPLTSIAIAGACPEGESISPTQAPETNDDEVNSQGSGSAVRYSNVWQQGLGGVDMTSAVFLVSWYLFF